MCAVTLESLPAGFLVTKSLRYILLVVRLRGATAVIKLIVITSVISLLAAAAQAQMSPFGGPIPFLGNPYPLYAPGQATESGPDASPSPSGGERCAPVYGGRGGAHYPCDDERQRGLRR